MLKKYIPYFALLAAGFLLWFVLKNQRGQEFNRNATHIIYTKHAKCRMDCRHINESEVAEILQKGTINYDKIENDGRGKTYPLEGVTHDKQRVRIVFAPKPNDEMVVVTVIDLDNEWSCDCK